MIRALGKVCFSGPPPHTHSFPDPSTLATQVAQWAANGPHMAAAGGCRFLRVTLCRVGLESILPWLGGLGSYVTELSRGALRAVEGTWQQAITRWEPKEAEICTP